MKHDKIFAEDILENEDIIWIEGINDYLLVEKVDVNLNGDIVLTFENGSTLFANPKREFILYNP